MGWGSASLAIAHWQLIDWCWYSNYRDHDCLQVAYAIFLRIYRNSKNLLVPFHFLFPLANRVWGWNYVFRLKNKNCVMKGLIVISMLSRFEFKEKKITLTRCLHRQCVYLSTKKEKKAMCLLQNNSKNELLINHILKLILCSKKIKENICFANNKRAQ